MNSNSTNNLALLLVPNAAYLLHALYNEVIGVGPGKSLPNELANAEAYYAANDVVVTCATLGGFTNDVQPQSGKKIGATLASTLIADADQIEDLIDCP